MNSMEYAKRACECIELAERMSGEARRKLVAISQAWLALADEAMIREQTAPITTGQTLSAKLQ